MKVCAMFNFVVTDRLAAEMRQWAEDQRAEWPENTVFQHDLSHLLTQMTPEGQRHNARGKCADCMGHFNMLSADLEASNAMKMRLAEAASTARLALAGHVGWGTAADMLDEVLGAYELTRK